MLIRLAIPPAMMTIVRNNCDSTSCRIIPPNTNCKSVGGARITVTAAIANMLNAVMYPNWRRRLSGQNASSRTIVTARIVNRISGRTASRFASPSVFGTILFMNQPPFSAVITGCIPAWIMVLNICGYTPTITSTDPSSTSTSLSIEVML